MTRQLIVLLVLLFISTAARAQDGPTPFGVTWGAGFEDTLQVLPGAKRFGASTAVTQFDPTGIITDAEFGAAIFGKGGRLYQIQIHGKPIENDPYGRVVRSRYDELREGLSAKYGKGEDRSVISDGYDGQYFGLGMKTGMNIFGHIWEVNGVEIGLLITAETSDSLKWVISYVYKSGEAAEKALAREKERDAL